MTDQNYLFSPLASDPELREILELFVEELPQRMLSMDAALSSANWENLERAAHQLKGASGSYGYHQLTESCHELEECAQSHQEEGARDALHSLQQLCERVRADDPSVSL